MNKNIEIETEIVRNFYRPAVSSLKLYREKLKAAQDAVEKAMKPSAAWPCKFSSLLVTIFKSSATYSRSFASSSPCWANA
jgi:hypothetical protein